MRIAGDGVPARVVKAHSLEKFDRHRRYYSTFNTGMKNRWKENRGYLELFAGPGLAIDHETVDEVDGCPLFAASIQKPPFINRLAFVERDEQLADALEQRARCRQSGNFVSLGGDMCPRCVAVFRCDSRLSPKRPRPPEGATSRAIAHVLDKPTRRVREP